tara:strand:- start:68 stop:226 length:159 start_codon:yes stop_codon:yes gene_type:complete
MAEILRYDALGGASLCEKQIITLPRAVRLLMGRERRTVGMNQDYLSRKTETS